METRLLRFPNDKSGFYEELKECVRNSITPEMHAKAVILLWIKLFFYGALFGFLYAFIYISNHLIPFQLVTLYIFIGLTGILLAFNAAHDAAHATFSRHERVNNFIYLLTFNLQGVSGYLWRIRHRSSHHIFPNVDGCDADIDDNVFLRLSPTQTFYWWHRYQHVYATFLYFLYTLHWIFIKDFIYLKKKQLANLKNQQHSVYDIFSLILWKLFYLFYMIVAPVVFGGLDLTSVLIAFLVMHAVISLFFVLTLIISHLCMETKFPVPDQYGMLPYGFYRHQLEVSLDYNPTNALANWIFGGFNSHSAHHLFSNLPHTLYAEITPLIRQTAKKYGYPYNELTFAAGILSHYSYLRKMSNASAM